MSDNLFLFSLQATEAFFGTQSSILVELFYKKCKQLKSHKLFLQKSSTIDLWLGCKYGSWQYCQKKKKRKKEK